MSAVPSSSFEITVAILGAVGTGKSALTISFVNNVFIDMYDPTIEDSFRKQVDVDGEPVLLTILDTAGAEEFHSIRDMNLSQADGILLVFSISDPQSFRDISVLHRDGMRTHNEDPDFPFVLVATKCDLTDSRVVTKEQGQQQAKELNCPFVETSAKLATGVTDAFQIIVREVRVYRQRCAAAGIAAGKKKGCLLL